MNAKRFALIVAGGSGSRMGADIPKQFITLNGLPILMHALNAFINSKLVDELILVLPEPQIEHWEKLCIKYHFKAFLQVTCGGNTRYQSVKNGLSLIDDPNALVAIHDGVRPFVSKEVIENCFATAENKGSAIPVIKPVESVRMITENGSFITDREKVVLVQTPQVFRVSLIKRAYEMPYQPIFTDDASVVEHIGEKVNLVEGNRENIKITTPLDLKIAETLIR